MRKQINVLPGFVYIKPDEPVRQTASGILIPDIALEKPSKGTVVYIHPKSNLDLSAGDKVFFSINAATLYEQHEEKLVIIREASITGKF